MATIKKIRKVFRRKVKSYEQEVEVWKEDHKMAMLYFDFCDLLTEGIELYRELNRLDENWRRSIYRKEADYDQETDEEIKGLFKRFSKVAFEIERDLIPYFEEHYGSIDHGHKYGREFRECCRELRGMFAGGSEFFHSDKLAELCDSALDEYSRGECESWPG